MNRSTLFAAGGIVLLAASASPAIAQSAPAPQQSSADLICQLAGDCASATETQTADDANGRMGRTRSFSISRKSSTPQKAEATPKQSTQSYAPSSRTKSRPTPPSSKIATPAKDVGRADLLITFLLGSTTLTEQAKANAQQFVVALRAPQLSGMRFAIEGHTDVSGSRAYNLLLSKQRAQAVVDYLVANGADPATFEAKGYGPDRLIDPQNPRSGSNRRVEVVKIKSN